MPRTNSTLAVVWLLLIVIRAAPAEQEPSQQSLGDDPSRFDERMEAATMRHDVGFFINVLADDVVFSHGTGLVQNKQQWVDSIREDLGTNVVRNLDSVKVEPHGDLVETVGHVQVRAPGKPLRVNLRYLVDSIPSALTKSFSFSEDRHPMSSSQANTCSLVIPQRRSRHAALPLKSTIKDRRCMLILVEEDEGSFAVVACRASAGSPYLRQILTFACGRSVASVRP